MSVVCYILAALSLGYFGLICVYSGISTDFCGVWIAIALIFLLMGIFIRRKKKDLNGMPKRFPIFIYTTFVLLAVSGLTIFLFIEKYSAVSTTEGCDYVIVIGERIYDDGISTTLKKRLDLACAYAERNPDTVFVLSGGTDSGDSFPEALAMYNYMAIKGIPEDRLLIEAESDSTRQNLTYSLAVISDDLRTRMIPPPIVIGVLTSDYHVFRTMKIGEEVYPEGLHVIVAQSDPIMFPHQCVRECCAVFRDHMIR